MDMTKQVWICPNHPYRVQGYFVRITRAGNALYECPNCASTTIFLAPNRISRSQRRGRWSHPSYAPRRPNRFFRRFFW